MEYIDALWSSTFALPVAVAISVVALTGTYYAVAGAQKGARNEDNLYPSVDSKSTPEPTATNPSNVPAATSGLKNVWDAPRNTPSLVGKKDYGEEKPFGSKYYYAHNNSRATGGYKDGLKMEDYTMNGPRLLSKGGKAVASSSLSNVSEASDGGASGNSGNVVSKSESTSSTGKITAHDPNLIFITKYLWDDPGDSKGIATIRIDSLPKTTASRSPLVDVKDVPIANVSAELAGEGLLVKVEASDGQQYQLKIPKLYGDAASVKAIVKPKRLLIKIQKKANAFLSNITSSNKSNLDAWPQPHRKF